MAKPKAVQFLAPDGRMLDLKRRAAMPGGLLETEVARTAETAVRDLESEFEALIQRKQQRMAAVVDGGNRGGAAAEAEELRWLAKDVQSTAPVFGYHAVGEMVAVLADTVERLDFDDDRTRRFCKWQVDALAIVIRRRLRGTRPQDVTDTIDDARRALAKLSRASPKT